MPHSQLILFTTSPRLMVGILSFSLPKNRPMVLGELKKIRMSARCRIRLMASPVLGSKGKFIEVIHCRSNDNQKHLRWYFISHLRIQRCNYPFRYINRFGIESVSKGLVENRWWILRTLIPRSNGLLVLLKSIRYLFAKCTLALQPEVALLWMLLFKLSAKNSMVISPNRWQRSTCSER